MNLTQAITLGTACFAAILSAQTAPASLVGDGSLSAPYRNSEVTFATLDQGGSSSAPVYNFLIDYTSPLFDSTTDFTMGASTSWNRFYVTEGSTLDALGLVIGGATQNNMLVLRGTGPDDSSTTLTVQENVYVGTTGMSNALGIESGADATLGANTDSIRSLYLGYVSSAPSSPVVTHSLLTVSGPGSTLSAGQVFVGNNSTANWGTVCNGAKVSSRNCNIGSSGSRCHANSVVLTDDGSEWDMASSVYVGYSGNNENWLLVANGALLKNDNGWSFTSGNYVGLAGGFIAFKGDKATAINNSLTSAFNIFIVWDDAGHAWSYGRTTNVSVTYYDSTQEADAYAATGISGLAGYTVISGGDRILGWADAVTTSRNWYASSWYGNFYTEISADMAADDDYSRWIWHEAHGWQYVYQIGLREIVLWDDASQAWVYANSNYYPLVYYYNDGNWYYYIEGTAPNRWFWDFGTGDWVQK